ncbi:hypothetical protein ACFSKW_28360 [Nonomuraea mangrovi]|uniref:Uncharacterized protein n=1 Tax=Nonomuraea mangrovi TaxID=2316207 RepID=A0ABW4T2K3_9ACTN
MRGSLRGYVVEHDRGGDGGADGFGAVPCERRATLDLPALAVHPAGHAWAWSTTRPGVFVEHEGQVAFAEDQDPAQESATHGADDVTRDDRVGLSGQKLLPAAALIAQQNPAHVQNRVPRGTPAKAAITKRLLVIAVRT